MSLLCITTNGSDGTFHREPDWNVDLRVSTWRKLPLSECGQRQHCQELGNPGAYPQCGLPHVTRVRVILAGSLRPRPLGAAPLSLKRVLGLWRIYGQRLFRPTGLAVVHSQATAVMNRIRESAKAY